MKPKQNNRISKIKIQNFYSKQILNLHQELKIRVCQYLRIKGNG